MNSSFLSGDVYGFLLFHGILCAVAAMLHDSRTF